MLNYGESRTFNHFTHLITVVILYNLYHYYLYLMYQVYKIEHFARVKQLLMIRARSGTQRRQWHPTPVLLPGKFHGQRSLVGCRPWGRKESDTTERLHFHFSLSCIGEGNGNPLQCSCLENPRDGGAWWAAVCGVSQSRTRLKRLSSSSKYTSMAQKWKNLCLNASLYW